jgi:hypothetical protein
MEALRSFETLETTHLLTWCHIPGDLHLQTHTAFCRTVNTTHVNTSHNMLIPLSHNTHINTSHDRLIPITHNTLVNTSHNVLIPISHNTHINTSHNTHTWLSSKLLPAELINPTFLWHKFIVLQISWLHNFKGFRHSRRFQCFPPEEWNPWLIPC